MEIMNLRANNLKDISCSLTDQHSLGIGGLSGSGKSTFCMAVAQESFRRIVTLLPKSEYRFLFSDQLESNCFSEGISGMPLVFYLRKSGSGANPRSTLGTHSGLFGKIRRRFAREHGKTSEFFSFNNSIMWCPHCKGRGSTAHTECKACGGMRYNDEILEYKLNLGGFSRNIVDVDRMSISELAELADDLGFDETDRKIIDNLIALGIPYLSLDRVMSTLSGGETMRVLLSEFMAVCRGALLILDEVSTGLDKDSLAIVLDEIRKLGYNNQVWFIDHSDMVLEAAEEHLYFGPYSGDSGGEIVEKSPRPASVVPPHPDFVPGDAYRFKTLEKRNIRIAELEVPKNCLIAVTGESGCGKSTLVRDCILPAFTKHYKDVKAVIIGQDRNQSITSKSTISTFLGIRKYTTKVGDGFESLSLESALVQAKKNKHIAPVLVSLVELGLGYLTLDRKIQTLSTGEFQSIHLISCLQALGTQESLIVLDEPSKGLSQNILNLFMKKLRQLQETRPITVLIIEHNEFVIHCCDLVFDFGKRQEASITELPCLPVEKWIKGRNRSQNMHPSIKSMIPCPKTGITTIADDVDRTFTDYDGMFKGGILKNYSSTAQWIYKDLSADEIRPIISLDFEGNLYSNHTFLFETASAINAILKQSCASQIRYYDYYDQENLCKCCRGTGQVSSFDFESIIIDADAPFWDGMLHSDVMKELKRYNYSKIKFLFKEIKKESGLQLDKPYSKMAEKERTAFLYGYWDNTFYDASKKTQRQWQGILHLVSKYMRSSVSPMKKLIKDSSRSIPCPICCGSLLHHAPHLEIRGIKLRNLLSRPLAELLPIFPDVPQLSDFAQVLGGTARLDMDVSTLSREEQVCLKCLEASYAKFYGFTFAFKNLAPFYQRIRPYVERLAVDNHVIMLDWDGIIETKDAILARLKGEDKISADTYCYELIGIKKIMTRINGIRKKEPCSYCKGSKVLRDESIFEGVDMTETPCMSCGQTGINESGLSTYLMGYPVRLWLSGTLRDMKADTPEVLADIPLCAKIRDLNKSQLYAVKKYLEDTKC